MSLRLNVTHEEFHRLGEILVGYQRGRLDAVEVVQAVDELLGAGTHARMALLSAQHGAAVVTECEYAEERLEVVAGPRLVPGKRGRMREHLR
jgi:hypothetical protein